MILALAGRRIDAPDAQPPRFPLNRVDPTRARLRALLEKSQARVLVSSAAAGADLLGLQEATRLGIRRRVVLPFDREQFKRSSVEDRPGGWGPIYDAVIDDAIQRGDLVILSGVAGDAAYLAATQRILDEADRLSAEEDAGAAAAVVVWEGRSRGEDDMTDAFRRDAEKRSFQIHEVLTL